jgi:hypothetical protein
MNESTPLLQRTFNNTNRINNQPQNQNQNVNNNRNTIQSSTTTRIIRQITPIVSPTTQTSQTSLPPSITTTLPTISSAMPQSSASPTASTATPYPTRTKDRNVYSSTFMPPHSSSPTTFPTLSQLQTQQQTPPLLTSSQISIQNIDSYQREDCMQSIERDVHLVSDMFRDMHELITYQQDSVTHLEYNVSQTYNATESGMNQIYKAEEYMRWRRKRMCCLTMCGATLLLIVIVYLYSWLH